MTDDQFQVLRRELSALRADIDRRFDGVEARLRAVEGGMLQLDAHLQDKPGKGYVYQALFTVNASFIALVALLILVFNTFMVQ